MGYPHFDRQFDRSPVGDIFTFRRYFIPPFRHYPPDGDLTTAMRHHAWRRCNSGTYPCNAGLFPDATLVGDMKAAKPLDALCNYDGPCEKTVLLNAHWPYRYVKTLGWDIEPQNIALQMQSERVFLLI